MTHPAANKMSEGDIFRKSHPLEDFMRASVGSVFPAGVLLVMQAGEPIWRRAYGSHTALDRPIPARIGSLFDLASLTKLFTFTAFMRLVEAGRVALESPVGQVLPAFRGERSIGEGEDPLKKVPIPVEPIYTGQRVTLDNITFRHLLTHTSGLSAWRSIYVVGATPGDVPLPHEVPASLRVRRIDAVSQYDFSYPTGEMILYSDLGFILLGEALQILAGKSLPEVIESEVCQPLGMQKTCFNPLQHDVALESILPAEVCAWRGRRLLGEVDDENAASLGGVAGHAGMFSTADEIARLGQMYLQNGWFAGRQILAPETVSEMRRQQAQWNGLRRGLGWVLQTPTNCSCGSGFSPQSYGHTGFTGTSLWVDPQRELVVVALTNRVYYGRNQDAIQLFRPALHDLIIQTLVEKKA